MRGNSLAISATSLCSARRWCEVPHNNDVTVSGGDDARTVTIQPCPEFHCIGRSRQVVSFLKEPAPLEYVAHIEQGVAATACRVIQLDHESVQVLPIGLVIALLARHDLVHAIDLLLERAPPPEVEQRRCQLLLRPN